MRQTEFLEEGRRDVEDDRLRLKSYGSEILRIRLFSASSVLLSTDHDIDSAASTSPLLVSKFWVSVPNLRAEAELRIPVAALALELLRPGHIL